MLEDGAKEVRQSLNLLILDFVKNEITFTFQFDIVTYRRSFFDPGMKCKYIDKTSKVNGHSLKLLHHESPTLKEEIVEELSLGKPTYAIIYSP